MIADGEGSGAGPEGWELLDHTADVGLRLWGSSHGALLRQAVDGFRYLVVGDSPVEATDTRHVELPAAGGQAPAEPLFRLLRELVFLNDTDRFVPAGINRESDAAVGDRASDGGGRQTTGVTVDGETFDPVRHSAWRQLKAVTRHKLEVQEAGGRYEATVIFDI